MEDGYGVVLDAARAIEVAASDGALKSDTACGLQPRLASSCCDGDVVAAEQRFEKRVEEAAVAELPALRAAGGVDDVAQRVSEMAGRDLAAGGSERRAGRLRRHEPVEDAARTGGFKDEKKSGLKRRRGRWQNLRKKMGGKKKRGGGESVVSDGGMHAGNANEETAARAHGRATNHGRRFRQAGEKSTSVRRARRV